MARHHGVDADETIVHIIRTTCYQWSPGDEISARSAFIPETFPSVESAEAFLMLHAEFYTESREGQFTTYTYLSYAPIPF